MFQIHNQYVEKHIYPGFHQIWGDLACFTECGGAISTTSGSHQKVTPLSWWKPARRGVSSLWMQFWNQFCVTYNILTSRGQTVICVAELIFTIVGWRTRVTRSTLLQGTQVSHPTHCMMLISITTGPPYMNSFFAKCPPPTDFPAPAAPPTDEDDDARTWPDNPGWAPRLPSCPKTSLTLGSLWRTQGATWACRLSCWRT